MKSYIYRSQIFIEKSKTLNYFFDIYDTLVYCDLAAFIHMSALVPVSLSASYETRGPFTVWGRMTFTLQERVSLTQCCFVPKEIVCLVFLLTLA